MKKGMNYVENRTALPPASNHFVLDALMGKGEEIQNLHLKKYKENGERVFSGEVDSDLAAPITLAMEQMGHRNLAVYNELLMLEEHVVEVWHAWKTYWQRNKSSQKTVVWSKAQKSANKLAESQWIDKLREDFASNPGPDKIGTLLALDPCLVFKLKASIAIGANGKLRDKFAFSMAYESLLRIKAEASGGISPITRSFGDILGVGPAIGRLYSQ